MVESPKITGFEWGEITISGVGSFRDAKVFPGGARGWDWNKTGTDHTPGIQIADIAELLEEGAEIVILSRGQQNQLKTMPETEKYLKEKGVDYEILTTTKAIDRFNELAEQGRKVAGLFHTTC